MNFCPECETCLVMRISSSNDSNNIMIFLCNNCGFTKDINILKNPEFKCVHHQTYSLKKNKINQKNLRFLSKDKTLPHVNNITCPNQQCITNKENPNPELLEISGIEKQNINDVLIIKLNESDLTFLYNCINCEHTWTNK